MNLICPLDLADPFFCIRMTIDMTTSMQNRIPNNFSSESFAQKCVPLPENSKNWKWTFSWSYRSKKFLLSFLNFPTKKRISGQNSLKKSCLGHDFALKWSCRLSFGHKKWTQLSPMDIYWPFKKYHFQKSIIHHFFRLQRNFFFLFYFFTEIFQKITECLIYIY